MSEDSKNLPESQEKFDIDSVEVNIFMIAKNPDGFKGAADFLTRRGWPTTIIGNISHAISAIVKGSPEIVLVSVNHPNPNVIRLPKLLAQTMNTVCIGFSETGDAVSIAKLNGSGFRYKISGFATGPSIHRQIRQILQTIYDPESVGSSEKSKQDVKTGPAHVTIKGSGSSEETVEYTFEASKEEKKRDGRKGESASNERVKLRDIAKLNPSHSRENQKETSVEEILSQLTEGTDGKGSKEPPREVDSEDQRKDEETKTNSETKNKFDLKSEKNEKKKKSRFPWQKRPERNEPIKNQKNRPGARFELRQPRRDETGSPIAENSKDGAEQAPILQGEIKAKSGRSIPTKQERENESRLRERVAKDDEFSAKQGANEVNDSSAMAGVETGQIQKLKKSSSSSEQNNVSSKKESSSGILFQERDLNQNESIFQQLVQQSLTSVVRQKRDELKYPVESQESVGIIAVDSESLHGYLVVGMSFEQHKAKEELLSNFRTEIENQFGAVNFSIKTDDAFFVSTESFDFKKWAEDKSLFYITAQSEQHEASVAFYSMDDHLPVMKENEFNPEMAKISISDISTKHPVNFKMYLHLKKNKKFFLYLNDGRNLLDRQKQKFEKLEISTELHIEKGDFENYKKYLATKLIRDEASFYMTIKKKSA